MMTLFEALNAPCRAISIDHIFVFIAVLVLGRRQSLAFDWQYSVEVNVAAALDPDGGVAGCRNQINLATFGLLIRLFYSKLKKIPSVRAMSGAVEMSTKLRCQRSLGSFSFPVATITPLRQLVSYEVDQLIPRCSWKMQVLAKSARASRTWGDVGEHRTSESLCPKVSKRFVCVTQSDRAQPIPPAIRLQKKNEAAIVNARNASDLERRALSFVNEPVNSVL